MKKEVAICFINKTGEKPNLMSSEEQGTQSVENWSKFVVANVEIDESSTVDNDVHLKYHSPK